MYESQIGNNFQRWIALTDAYAQQIERRRIDQFANQKRLSVMAVGLQRIGQAFMAERAQVTSK